MYWHDWIALFLRWFHVIAGIAWIGASFYFIWLDNSLRTPPKWKQDKGIKGDLWAVHGGGFYEVAKYQYGPDTVPEKLHWFKWEAYTTWITGMLLMIWVYYAGAEAYLIDTRVYDFSANEAILAGLGFIVSGLVVYEIACRSPLSKNAGVFGVFLVLLLTAYSWGAAQLFSGRGAYMHIGALIGTIMAGNVLFNIIPSQRKMVEAVKLNATIDPSWGAGAKLRSVHNNYLTLPIIFIMISNHYPMTYQHPDNWLVLVCIALVSAWIRHYFNLKHLGISRPSILIFGAILMAAIAFWVSKPTTTQETPITSSTKTVSKPMPDVVEVIQQHCTGCHSKTPSDEIFVIAPLGITLDTWQEIDRWAPQIYRRTVVTQDMPMMNKTNMQAEERLVIADWFESRSE
ncbi:MAG: urate hydroxylase PuuD [Aestuariibacter sp.]